MRITGDDARIEARSLVNLTAVGNLPIHGLEFLNVRISARVPPAVAPQLTGPGLYAMAYQGRVAYVGSYLGAYKSSGNPQAGCIVQDRWHRHLATLTCRGHRVSSGKTVAPKMLKRYPESELLRRIVDDNVRYAGRDGYSAARMRLRFAHHHWGEFRSRTAENLLDGFEYVFLRVHPEAVSDISRLVKIVDSAETLAIAEMLPVVNDDKKVPREYRRDGIPWRDADAWTPLEEASAALRRALLSAEAALP